MEPQKPNQYQPPSNLDSPSQYSFFLFINSGSGGGIGNKLVSQEIQKIQFLLQISDSEQPKICHTYFYNMRNEKMRNIGLKNLKIIVMNKNYSKTNPEHKCIAIVCGGDGTVMWLITQMIKNDIEVTRVPVGIIPLGTGNDFSRQLGWGGQKTTLTQNNYKSLKKLIKLWIHAKEQYFDIWDMQAQIFENGKFEKVQNGQNALIQGNRIKKTFCNYFSFGIDGKIGYSFDMHRTTTRLGNLAMYSLVGVAKTMTKTKSIDQLVDTIEINHNFVSKSAFEAQNIKKQQKQIKSLSSSLFKSKTKSLKLDKKMSEQPTTHQDQYFNSGFSNVLMLNVNSYTGGVTNIWEKASNGFFQNVNFDQEFTDVSTGDGKLEIVSFPSSMSIALERGIGGFSKKISQGNGPFKFTFKRYQKQLKHRTYLQIDGQFIRFTHPKSILVKQSQLVPKGKIKVLRKNPKYDPMGVN